MKAKDASIIYNGENAQELTFSKQGTLEQTSDMPHDLHNQMLTFIRSFFLRQLLGSVSFSVPWRSSSMFIFFWVDLNSQILDPITK